MVRIHEAADRGFGEPQAAGNGMTGSDHGKILSSFPPGNSHKPPSALYSGRRVARTVFVESTSTKQATGTGYASLGGMRVMLRN
jgi:hypothetical protein